MSRPLGCCLVRLILLIQSHPTVAWQSRVNKTSTGSLHRTLAHSLSSPFLFTAPQRNLWENRRVVSEGQQPDGDPVGPLVDTHAHRRMDAPPPSGTSVALYPRSSSASRSFEDTGFFPHDTADRLCSSIVATTTGRSTSTVARWHPALQRWWS
jgi:hypothetical protein